MLNIQGDRMKLCQETTYHQADQSSRKHKMHLDMIQVDT